MASEVSTEVGKQRHLELRAPPKAASVAVLGVIPARPEWVAAYSLLKLGKGDSACIAGVCRFEDLPGPQRKRADSWRATFATFVDASNPPANASA